MEITAVRTIPIDLPLARPFRSAIHDIRSMPCVLAYVDTDEGLTGEGYLWVPHCEQLPLLSEAVGAAGVNTIGIDPADHAAVWQAMAGPTGFIGHGGPMMFGLAAVDMACWDLAGKALGVPVARLLGRAHQTVPVYADGGLFVTMTVDELQIQAHEFVDAGYRAVKMRIGYAAPSEDIERIAAVREAIGPDIALMADANQGLDVRTAIRLGRGMEPYDIHWFEEPVPADDLAGCARVARDIAVPVATGQSLFGRNRFHEALALGAADVLMPDLMRVGGFSEMVKIAHMIEGAGASLSPHMFAEQNLHLCAALTPAPIAEDMPWFELLFNQRLDMVDGQLAVPDRPGFGFTFNSESVEKYRLDR